jgi:RHS repeat-associated protein
LTASLVASDGTPIPGQNVSIVITGPNATTLSGTTDSTGSVTVTYSGMNPGTDTAQATATRNGITLASSTSTIGWVKPVTPIGTGPVDGNFYPVPDGTKKFIVTPASSPAFEERFPTIVFDPPTSAVPNNKTGVTTTTRPFTDVTLDPVGDGVGTIPAAGNGEQAGVGDLHSFNAVFTSTFSVTSAGSVTYKITYDSSYELGIGGGATATGSPTGATPFQGLPLVAADNAGTTGVRTATVTVNFPTAGTYPYELDYAGGDPNALSLVLASVQIPAQDPLTVSSGYDAGAGARPTPWLGSPGVTFIGRNDADSGALRFDNNTSADIKLDSVTVTAGSFLFNPWAGMGLVVPANGTLILEETQPSNFDVDDYVSECSTTVATINVTVSGKTTAYKDTRRALNGCGQLFNFPSEGAPWGALNNLGTTVPIVSTATVQLLPAHDVQTTVGKQVTVSVNVLDGSGAPAVGVPVRLIISDGAAFRAEGANFDQTPPPGVTDEDGIATFTYTGVSSGMDLVQGIATVDGVEEPSNSVNVTWTVPPFTPPTSTPTPSPTDTSPSPTPLPTDTSPSPTPSPTDTSCPSASPTDSPSPTDTASPTDTDSPTDSPTPTPIGSPPPETPSPTDSPSPTDTASDGAGSNFVVRDDTCPSPSATPTDTSSPSGSPTPTHSPTPTPTPTHSTPPGAPPSITGLSPADGTRVTAPTPVTATLTPPSGGWTITNWQVTVQNINGGPTTTIGSGAGAPPATLATLDPTALVNGTYKLAITGTASTNGTNTIGSTVIVDGQLKPGRYVADYTDLKVPVAGFTMAVDRHYDSDNTQSGAFGVGWTLSLSSLAVTANRTLGDGGWVQYDASCTFGICTTGYRTTVPHTVTITYPSGHQDIFDFTPKGLTGEDDLAVAGFTARTGTTSTLAVVGNADLISGEDGNLYDEDTGDLYSPTRYQLTTGDGLVYVVDTASGLVSVKDSNGNTLSVTSSGITSSSGQSLTLIRDSSHRITKITGPSGETVQYSYDASGNLHSVTDALGHASTYSYIGHRLTGTAGPDGQPISSETFDPASGRLTSVTDSSGHTTGVDIDLTGRTVTTHDPSGTQTTIDHYDDLGDRIEEDVVTAGNILTTTWSYDSLGRLVGTTDPDGNTTHQAFDAAGDVTSFTDEAGRSVTNTYSPSGQLLTSTAPGGRVTTYTYDAHGNLTGEQDPGQAAISIIYNSNGEPASVSQAGSTQSYSYDSKGNLTAISDGSGTVTATYNGSGQVTATTNQLGQTTTFGRDVLGNVTGITDALGNAQTYRYDDLDRVSSYTDSLNHNVNYNYGSDGNLASVTDRDGNTTTFTYNADGNVTEEDSPDDATTFSYDDLGRLAQITDNTAILTYTYDGGGRVLTESTKPSVGANLPSATESYMYDPTGALTSITSPGGTTKYTYDPSTAALAKVTSSAGAFSFSYDSAADPIGLQRQNGVSDTIAYNQLGDVTSKASTVGSSTLSSASYTYDTTGLLTGSTTQAGTVTYGYDAARRLTSVTPSLGSTAPSESYQYDAAGNRSPAGHSWTYGPDDQLLSDGTYNYQYDHEGQLISKAPVGSGAKTTYTWNAEHELTKASPSNGSPTTYKYDPLGRLVEAASPSTTTRYVYSGDEVIADYDGNNQLLRSYTLTGADTPLAATTPSGTSTYFLTDAIGSVVATANDAGSLTTTFGYTAFGQPTGTKAGARFADLPYDPTSGLYLAGARDYDPASGRFISEDSEASANPYLYAGNNPLSDLDPTGRETLLEEEEVAGDQDNLESQNASTAKGVLNAVYRFFNCESQKFYYGITNNLERRLAEHGEKVLEDSLVVLAQDVEDRGLLRGIEQQLINRAGGSSGPDSEIEGLLSNAINSIGANNPKLDTLLEQAENYIGLPNLESEAVLVNGASQAENAGKCLAESAE